MTDLDVAVERAGCGPPVVLLHGYVGDGPTTWRRQIDELSDAFTVVAWDAPGAGQSSDPPETFGMAGYADCLAATIDRLELARPHVVGLSFGGALAIELCFRYRTVPATLTLAGAYAGWAGSLPPDVVEQRLQQAFTLSEASPAEFVDALLPTMFSEGTPEEVAEAYRSPMLAFHPVGFRAMARASAEDLRPALPHIDVPTLLIYGADDTRAPRPVAEHLHQAIALRWSSCPRPVMSATSRHQRPSTPHSATSSDAGQPDRAAADHASPVRVSDVDHDLAPSAAVDQVPDGSGGLGQRIGPVHHGSDGA